MTNSVDRQYMAVNLHWTSPSTGVLVESCLAVRAFPVPHTAEASAAVVKQVGAYFGVPEERVFFAVTDNATVMEAAVRDHLKLGSTKRFHCIAHWLQLLVQDALKTSGASDAILRVRLYVKKVLRRSKWAARLAQLQKEEYPKKAPRKLFLDGGVRWSATYLMCERVAALERAILKHLQELRTEEELMTEKEKEEEAEEMNKEEEEKTKDNAPAPQLPTALELRMVRQLVPLLRPVYNATNVVQADCNKASISVILPEVLKLYSVFQPGPLEKVKAKYVKQEGKVIKTRDAIMIAEADLTEVVKELRKALLVHLGRRFGAGSAPILDGHMAFYCAATFLDPRKRDLATLATYHPKNNTDTRTHMTHMAAKFFLWEEETKLALAREEEEGKEKEQEGTAGDGIKEGGGPTPRGQEDEDEEDDEHDDEVEEVAPALPLTADQLDALHHADLHAAAGGGGGGGVDVVGGGAHRPRKTQEEHVRHAELEMDRWLQFSIGFNELGKSLPLEWWAQRQMREDFPYFSNLARRLLSIPASSATAERVFSQAGLVITDLRTRLGMRTLEDLMVIKYHHSEGQVYKTPKEWHADQEEEEEEE